nr:MAG TPA: hypothetical protein [Caudoviricetes sp.]
MRPALSSTIGGKCGERYKEKRPDDTGRFVYLFGAMLCNGSGRIVVHRRGRLRARPSSRPQLVLNLLQQANLGFQELLGLLHVFIRDADSNEHAQNAEHGADERPLAYASALASCDRPRHDGENDCLNNHNGNHRIIAVIHCVSPSLFSSPDRARTQPRPRSQEPAPPGRITLRTRNRITPSSQPFITLPFVAASARLFCGCFFIIRGCCGLFFAVWPVRDLGELACPNLLLNFAQQTVLGFDRLE